jgi:hypothetical protein
MDEGSINREKKYSEDTIGANPWLENSSAV